ncbi:MAG: M20/M25/M40 family metallo-hydrolase [Desulfatibacillaceae bacterium]
MDEAVRLLSEYIALDTSNPPGNEDRATAFFAEILGAGGIPYRTYEAAPGRASIRAVIPGSGQKAPLLLLNHTDVVAANPDEWTFDPFGGKVSDGYVHGRGALDMKGIGVMQLMAFLALARSGATPNRDVIFAATADEEAGGAHGIGWLLDDHPGDFKAGVVLNEGGFALEGFSPTGPMLLVSPGEKGFCWMRVTAEGKAGHGSMPAGANAVEKLVRALARVAGHEPPPRITPVSAGFFRALASGLDILAPYLDDGRDDTLLGLLKSTGLIGIPTLRAMVSDTLSVNTVSGGEKVNVIPSAAEANIDARLLPGEDPDTFAGMIAGIAGPDVEVHVEGSCPASVSEWEHEAVRAIARSAAKRLPDATLAPFLMPGTSDSRFFRARGIPSYGLCPAVIANEEVGTIHGADERISEDNLRLGVRVYGDVVQDLCGL